MKIAILLTTVSLICLLSVYPVSTQWEERESPVLENNLPVDPFYVNQRLTKYWQITYPCKVNEGKPKPRVYWQWFYDGVWQGLIDSNFGPRVLNHTNLALKTIDPRESYQCVAENEYGTALSNKITILESDTAVFDVKRESNPYSITSDAGQSLVMDCKTNELGKPIGIYTWSKGKEDIAEGMRRVFTNEVGSLIFTYLEQSDKNEYMCSNRNPNLYASTSGGWTNLTVNPIKPPPENVPIRLLYKTSNTIAMFGKSFSAQCIYGGKPTPTVTWFGPLQIESKGYTMSIKVVTEAHEGKYICKANIGQNSMQEIINVDVKAPPLWVEKPNAVKIVTEGTDAHFICKARALKSENELKRPVWMKNGKDLNLPYGQVKDRLGLSLDGTTLTFRNVTKREDICNFQCFINNTYGEVFADISFNVILKTDILKSPEDQVISRGDVAAFHIKAKVDPLVEEETTYTWNLDGNKIELFDISDVKIFMSNWTLIVNTSLMDEDRFQSFLGNYSIVIHNKVETVVKFALLKQNSKVGETTMQSAFLDAKWIALIVALVLFFIIFILLLCILLNRQGGDEYSVDKKERKAGHDPEKELADGGFHDLPRTDDDPGLQKPDNLSISSAAKSIGSDTDSMGEYSDTDAGSRFNEDGSFIGAYQGRESKGNGTNV